MVPLELKGINVQFPWAAQILSGSKTIETRTYPLFRTIKNEPLWLIETPGDKGAFEARVVGIVFFSNSKQYRTEEEFRVDILFHCISKNSEYWWSSPKNMDGILVKYYTFLSRFLPLNNEA